MFNSVKYQMPQKFGNVPPNWDDIEDACQHIPLNCPWTITSEDETRTVVITCLKWTFNDDFWMRVTAHPEGNPNFSKEIDINKHKPLLESLLEALNDYEDFPEPPFELPSTSYSWRIIRLPILKRCNPHNGQYAS